MKKIYVVLAFLLVAAILIPACGPTTPDCTKPEVFCVGLVTDVGKIDDVRARADAAFAAGATELLYTPAGPDIAREMQAFASAVL